MPVDCRLLGGWKPMWRNQNENIIIPIGDNISFYLYAVAVLDVSHTCVYNGRGMAVFSIGRDGRDRMMEISGEISQLKVNYGGNAYLNVIQAGYGGIGVWCSTYCPTYLLQEGSMVYFVQFEDEEYAKEWVDEHRNQYDKIQRLGGPN